ncbi:protein hunchback [Athalia rosae]|uniref:protein hunchback n=1 Tax=Athalia rosae TaxID=37344 RepID=UPI002033A1E5|nr:protein hunchback [Athalia rosae]
MRGNWSTGDPVGGSTGQEINSEPRDLPLHSPATPAWNIADRIVKEEPTEDKNNDSGVSPGHYTSNSASPRSRRSSSTANGSLSPGSATSQDSSAMQYDYSPQRLFKSCISPLDFTHGNHDRVHSPKMSNATSAGCPYNPNDMEIQTNRNVIQSEQPLDMVSSTMKPDNERDVEILQCPICPFSTSHRLQFNEHLTQHCSPKCDVPDYATSSYTQLSSLSEDGARGSPSQGDRSEHEFDETDEPGLRVPRVNCQGKVKTFRCKQCNFVAITKLEFWEHSRGHIKAEKLLTCPKCPFVTEYKHHLEYHLRNHFGSKPFKCDKCPYSCVNKSMLNSHLKSHSNVYQYRCAECSYATKYCHSLKLHLRKYGHKPAMVLNPDGSPNPLPIIDIYGTRRGPKQKSSKTIDDVSVTPIGNPVTSPSTGKMPMIQSVPIPGLGNMPFVGDQMNHPGIGVPFPYSQIFNGVNLPAHFLQHFHHDNNNDNLKHHQEVLQNSLVYDGFKMDDYASKESKRLSPMVFGMNSDPQTPETTGPVSPSDTRTSSSMDNQESKLQLQDQEIGTGLASPLDLSKQEVNQNSKTNSPKSGGTSRRKGRAFKLDKLMIAQDSEDEGSAGINATNESTETTIPSMDLADDTVKDDQLLNSTLAVSDYSCHYCDIAFGNVVMYTMHMGYHGYKSPYTCNMCGQECHDKVSFFLHIARSSHS